MMCKTLGAILILFCIAFFVPQSVSGQDVSPNTLSAAEKATGWKLLFDGKSLSGWRRFRQQDPPGPCWVIENSALKRENGHMRGECGDIVTKDEYSSFEFAFEWRIAPCPCIFIDENPWGRSWLHEWMSQLGWIRP